MLRLRMAAGLVMLAAMALPAFAPAVAEIPKADWSACIRGELSSRKIDPNQRIGACNRLLQNGETNPGDAGAILAARAAAHNDLRQYADALQDIESALAQNTRSDAWEFIYRVMGQAQSGLRNFAAAEVAFQQATTYVEADGWSWDRLGNAKMQQGKYREAEGDYRKALELNPEFAELWSDAGDSQFAQGRFAEAAPLYAKAIDLANGQSAWDSLFHYLATAGAEPAAVDQLRKAAGEWAEEDSYFAIAGRLLAGAIGEPDLRAGIGALAAREGRPEDAEFWINFALGQRDRIAGSKATAAAYLRKAAATNSIDAVYLNAAQFAP
ncbi:MAG TPA: tetratricopeptide repeat protein [Alphaproteobacteria bacterium]|nr:tetratricopeptide repeat protein [Alphaproteobacteria bacterium]